MSGALKAAHVHADFSQDAGRCFSCDTWNADEQFDRFLKWGEGTLNLKKELEDRLIQKADVGERVRKQDVIIN